jgi:hypothetical protein
MPAPIRSLKGKVMLQTTALSTPAPAAFQPAPVRTISGQSIAKSEWGKHNRAYLAARWKLGTVRVEPTIKLAAEVFGVSEQLVTRAVARQRGGNGAVATPPGSIDSWWAALSESDRDDFVRKHLLALWDSIERVTG